MKTSLFATLWPMVLQVPFDQFAQTVRRVLGGSDAYVSAGPSCSVLTACGRDGSVIVRSVSELSEADLRANLAEQKIQVYAGQWTLTPTEMQPGSHPVPIFVAGVAYKTESGPPGLWMDGFSHLPSHMQVLRGMYDEMMETGELAPVSFEDFVRLSTPNVVITSPEDLQKFVDQKQSS